MEVCRPTFPSSLPCRIAIVGDFPGEKEEDAGRPFVGSAGQELDRLLLGAEIDRRACYLTNVFHARPPANKIESWCDNKAGVTFAYKIMRDRLVEEFPDYTWPQVYNWEKVGQGKYIHPRFIGALPRLAAELQTIKPNLVIALGGLAAWALLNNAAITRVRGAATDNLLVPGMKVLPTFHPAYILRNWSDRIISVADFDKAAREQHFPEIRRKARLIHIPETIADLYDFHAKHLVNAKELGCDIETYGEQITSISFSPSPTLSLIVPFTKGPRDVGRKEIHPGEHFWETLEDEVAALRFCRTVLRSGVPKIFQNGMYDIQYILWTWKFYPANCIDDTMLMHHSLQPELRKDLGFLGSIHTDEAAWKLMRKRGDDLKKDE